MTAAPATTPADIIGVVPHSLGYTPSDSLVAVIVETIGERMESSLTLRVDFTEQICDSFIKDSGQELTSLILRGGDDITGVFFIAYSDIDNGPLREAIDVFAIRLIEHDISTLSAWQVSGNCFYRIDTPEDVGTPLIDAQASVLATEMTVKGSSPVGDAADLIPKRKSAEGREAFLSNATTVPKDTTEAFTTIRRVYQDVDDLRRAGTSGEVSRYDQIAALNTILTQKRSRDGLELLFDFRHPDFVPDTIRAMSAVELAIHVERIALEPSAAARLVGMSPEMPDTAGSQLFITLIENYSVWADDDVWDQAAAVIDWFHWAMAGSTMAELWAEAALNHNSNNSLAELILSAVQGGFLPRWLMDNKD